MRGAATTAAFFAVIFSLDQRSALGAECTWGTPENGVIESSVPDGVLAISKEIKIGQPFNVALAAIQQEFPRLRIVPSEIEENIDGKCKLKFPFEISVSSSTEGRTETLTAQFSSPRLGGQLLALERHIRYGDGVSLPLVSEIVDQLHEKFGEPSVRGITVAFRGHMPVYYFAYKDRKKIPMDLDGIPARGGWHPCRHAANLYPPRIFDSSKYGQCDFIAHAYFEVMEPSKDASIPRPQNQRYREVWIQFLDLKRARMDVAARNSWINGLKREFDENAAKKAPKDKI